MTISERSLLDVPVPTTVTERDLKVNVERELVSQAEEEDMEALLGTYVIHFSASQNRYIHFQLSNFVIHFATFSASFYILLMNI